MGIYMGGTKCKLVTNGNACGLRAQPYTVVTNGMRLVTSDGFTLTDSKGLYTTLKDEKYNVRLLSLDDYILNDTNGLYLISEDDQVYNIKMSSLDNYVLKDLNELYLTTRKGG